MSVCPADGDNTAGAQAPEPPIVKKAWTQPDRIERHANGDSCRGSEPAEPSDEPPALGVEEDTVQPNQKLKRRKSLTALLPYPSPVTSSVQHCRSAASVGTLSWNLESFRLAPRACSARGPEPRR